MDLMGIIGIFIAMICLIILVYKGMSTIYVAPISAMIVVIFSGMPLLDSFLKIYLGGIAGWMEVGFVFVIVGSIFAKIYATTGAAESIGRNMIDALCSEDSTQRKKILISLLSINLLGLILTWTGISGTVIILSTFPIAKSIAKSVNIPRRFMPALLMNSGMTAAMAGPGSPTIGNITAPIILGTQASASPIPGLIGVLIVLIAGITYMYKVICKSVDNGEKFIDMDDENIEYDKSTFPNIFISIAPLIVVFITFTLLQLSLIIGLSLGITIALILLSKYIPDFSIKNVFHMLNDGAGNGAIIYFNLASLIGFSAVVQASTGFNDIMLIVTQLNGNPLVIATIGIIIFVLITSSPPAALTLGLPTYIPAIQSGTVAASALHRTAVFATTTFESMPYSGAAVTTIQLSKVTYKESYKPIFVCTVLVPFLATGVVTALLVVFPGLA